MTNNKATITRPKNAPLSKQPQTSVKSTPKATKNSGQHPPKQYTRQKKNNNQPPPSKPHVTKAAPTVATTATTSPSPRSNKKPKQEWDALKNQRLPSKHQQQRKPNVMPSKARRVERKRDIASMTDAIQSLDLSSSPPCSSSESDNSDVIQTSKKKVNKQRSTTMSKPGPAAFPPLKRLVNSMVAIPFCSLIIS